MAPTYLGYANPAGTVSDLLLDHRGNTRRGEWMIDPNLIMDALTSGSI
jgi:hypothetical protein